MTLSPADIVSIFTSLSRWELAEYISEGFVALGCIGEYVADFCKYFKPKRREDAKEQLSKASTLVLIVALAGELICLVRTNQLSESLTGNLGSLALSASSNATDALIKSGQAVTDSGTAVSQSASAKTSAGSAKMVAESARNTAKGVDDKANELGGKVAYINNELAVRFFTDEQVLAISKSCSKFAGKRVQVSSYSTDLESLLLTEQLVSALSSSTMLVDDQARSVLPSPGSYSVGLSIWSPDRQLAEDLSSTITSALGPKYPYPPMAVDTDPRGDSVRWSSSQGTEKSLELLVFVGLKPSDATSSQRLIKAFHDAHQGNFVDIKP